LRPPRRSSGRLGRRRSGGHKLTSGMFRRAAFEAEHQADAESFRDPLKSRDAGLVAAAFEAGDGGMAGTNPPCQFLLGDS
jgi:hypothetical protein